MSKYLCVVCQYVYDEEEGGISWSELPTDWVCPVCGKVNAPTNDMCIDECISKEVAENAKKHGTKQLLID